MSIGEWLNLIAIIIIPIAAVIIGQYLQNRAEIRKDKMSIFKTLMTARIYGWTPQSVDALNVIDVIFVKDKKVRSAWKDLNDKYCVTDPDEQHLRKIIVAQYKLLEEMAKTLGYKDEITWETIQNPYMPQGMGRRIEEQNQMNQMYLDALRKINLTIPEIDNSKFIDEGNN